MEKLTFEIPDDVRVLVVDDEAAIRDVLTMALKTLGLEAVEAESVAEARAHLGPHIGAAIIDKNLPDGSGLELLAPLKAASPHAQPMVLTAFPSFESVVEAMRQGAVDYIAKPLRHIDEIRHKAVQAMERHVLLRERDNTLQELQRAQRLQELAAHSQTLAELGKLLASTMHEVRTPLTYVMGNASLMLHLVEKGTLPTDDAKRLLGTIVEGCERIIAIMHDVKRVSRLDPRPGESGPVDLQRLMHTVETLVRGQLRNRAELKLEVPTGMVVTGSASRLSQVLINLLINAAEAMPRRGSITVRADRNGDRIRLEVVDNGPGIDEDTLERIFEPFFTTRGDDGTGLGLAIAKEIVESHGGTLSAVSTLGEGSTFTVQLPAHTIAVGE